MAQKPVLTSFMAELEPAVEKYYKQHVDTSQTWYAHDFVPFERGENFAFMGGRDWDPSDSTLPSDIGDALEILLIAKDALPGYHREFVEHFVLQDWWGIWIGRWTAEENLHPIVLREYLVVTRGVDPVANEAVRVEHMMKGYRAQDFTKIETLVFMALWERMHAVYCRRLAAKIEDPTLRDLVSTIARDEERHCEFFDHLVRECARIELDETVSTAAARAAELSVLGADIDSYQDKVRNVAAAGIFDEEQRRLVVSDSIKAWGLADRAELSEFVEG